MTFVRLPFVSDPISADDENAMAGLIPQSFIDDLLNRTDIVDVVS